MEFWKTHEKMRVVLMIILFIIGICMTIVGWRMTGQLAGLGLMMVGVLCLLATLWIYNKPFEKGMKKKS